MEEESNGRMDGADHDHDVNDKEHGDGDDGARKQEPAAAQQRLLVC